MKKEFLVGTFIFTGILLMSSSASSVEYRAVIEQNTNNLAIEHVANQIKTVSEKLTEFLSTMKITQRNIVIRLIEKFIKVIFSLLRMFVRMSLRLIILVLKIIRFPFKLVTRATTLLIHLIQLIILLPYLHIEFNNGEIQLSNQDYIV